MPEPRYECCETCYREGRHDPAQRLAHHRAQATKAAVRAGKWGVRSANLEIASVLVPVVVFVLVVLCCGGYLIFRR